MKLPVDYVCMCGLVRYVLFKYIIKYNAEFFLIMDHHLELLWI